MFTSQWNLSTTIEDWEYKAARKLMIQIGLVAILATALCVLFAQILILLNIQGFIDAKNTYAILILPWVLILVFGSRYCFHRGVVDEFVFAVGEGSLKIDKDAPHFWRIVDWEKEYINRIVLGQVIFAAIGTLAFVGFGHLLDKFTDIYLSPAILFSPWAVVMIVEVSRTYHLGVLAQRTRIRGRRDADRRTAPRRRTQTAKKKS